MENKELRDVYEMMHRRGPSSWFSSGKEERETILKCGQPWQDKYVLEIGCGEGDLAWLMMRSGAIVTACDYSEAAIKRAVEKYPPQTNPAFFISDYRNISLKFDRLVMQGVLEHFDEPFKELKWIMDNLLSQRGDIITSSPYFLNPRGIVWKTLDMLGAVMSKTDQHYLDPWEFIEFCKYRYDLHYNFCDNDWGCGLGMIEDLKKRLPFALRDGKIPYDKDKLDDFIKWLSFAKFETKEGATAVYHIKKRYV